MTSMAESIEMYDEFGAPLQEAGSSVRTSCCWVEVSNGEMPAEAWLIQASHEVE